MEKGASWWLDDRLISRKLLFLIDWDRRAFLPTFTLGRPATDVFLYLLSTCVVSRLDITTYVVYVPIYLIEIL